MAIRIILLLIGLLLTINLGILTASFLAGVNLYKKYPKQISNFFVIFIIAILVIFVAISFVGLI